MSISTSDSLEMVLGSAEYTNDLRRAPFEHEGIGGIEHTEEACVVQNLISDQSAFIRCRGT